MHRGGHRFEPDVAAFEHPARRDEAGGQRIDTRPGQWTREPLFCFLAFASPGTGRIFLERNRAATLRDSLIITL